VAAVVGHPLAHLVRVGLVVVVVIAAILRVVLAQQDRGLLVVLVLMLRVQRVAVVVAHLL
jgi:hypothetical protein